MSAQIRLTALSFSDIMNEKRSHTLNTLGVPPSLQTEGQWARGAEIKEGDNRGEGVVDADRAEKKGEGEKRKEEAQDTGHTGQEERKGSERPMLGHSPLGWLGENATAHYMLCLCSVDEQCTITIPCCSSSPYCCMPLRRAILLL